MIRTTDRRSIRTRRPALAVTHARERPGDNRGRRRSTEPGASSDRCRDPAGPDRTVPRIGPSIPCDAPNWLIGRPEETVQAPGERTPILTRPMLTSSGFGLRHALAKRRHVFTRRTLNCGAARPGRVSTTLDKLTSLGLAFDQDRGTGTIITVHDNDRQGFGGCCVVAKDERITVTLPRSRPATFAGGMPPCRASIRSHT